MPLHVKLEGPPFAGKSTIANRLHETYGFEVVGDPATFMPEDERQGWIAMPTDRADNQAKTDYWLEYAGQQAERVQAALGAGKHVVSDRGPLLPAVVNLAAAREPAIKELLDAGVDLPIDPDYAIEATERAGIEQPDVLFLVRAADGAVHKERHARREAEGTAPPAGFYTAWGTAEKMHEAYTELIPTLMPGVQVEPVVSTNDIGLTMAQITPIIDQRLG